MLKEQEINLVSLVDRFHDEDRCRRYLEGLRWPDGLECPRCGGKVISQHNHSQPTGLRFMPLSLLCYRWHHLSRFPSSFVEMVSCSLPHRRE